MTSLYGQQNSVIEWSYASGKSYANPFNEIQLDVVVTAPDGTEQTVPAFWGGEQIWRLRYASPQTGTHRFRTVASDTANSDLHGREGALEITPYTGTNPLLKHGALRVAADKRHLEHRDGAPFFWLGDTWWMGFCKRLKYPEDFAELTNDRVRKGFTLIQIIAGLYPDMPPFDERGANEAGYPWEKDFSRINPAYFDQADVRVAHLVRAGLVPCIVGFWGYFLDVAGADVLKKHWRYLIARYGAYPVVWCAAGEALMPYYLSPAFHEMMNVIERDGWLPADRRAVWSDLMRYLRTTDSYDNPLAIHPTRYGHDQTDDPSVMDLDWLQTGHGGYRSLKNTIDMVESALAHEPKMPVLVSEVDYEGILEGSREENQRFLFWACLLSGTLGHTYGANGIWQVNTREKPFGASPHGLSWGNRAWNDAYTLPGSKQIGLGKQLLERYAWEKFKAHPEWVEPHQTADDRLAPYAAGIPGEVRIIYIPVEAAQLLRSNLPVLKQLEPNVAYRGFYWDPSTGEEYPCGAVQADAQGDYPMPLPPIFRDWVFVMERRDEDEKRD